MSQITLRDANYSDLPEAARVMSKAFWNDNLFGDLIHPHREKYPDDPDLYWLRRARVSFWDYRWRGIVAIAKDDSGKDVIAGIAQWERLGKEERNSNVHISIPIRILFFLLAPP